MSLPIVGKLISKVANLKKMFWRPKQIEETSATRIINILKTGSVDFDILDKVNDIMEAELGIKNFIPDCTFIKDQIAVETEISGYTIPKSVNDENANERVTFPKMKSWFDELAESTLSDKLRANIKKAKKELRDKARKSARDRISTKLNMVETDRAESILHDGNHELILDVLMVLNIVYSKVDETQMSINDLKNFIRSSSDPGAQLSDKIPWNATLKEAAGIIRNNYDQDQLKPPGERKYTHLVDASNEFFNTHIFPRYPDLTAEKLYENVKKYPIGKILR